MLEAEGHQGTDDRCAAYADVPEADTLGLFVSLVPVDYISLKLSWTSGTRGWEYILPHRCDQDQRGTDARLKHAQQEPCRY